MSLFINGVTPVGLLEVGPSVPLDPMVVASNVGFIHLKFPQHEDLNVVHSMPVLQQSHRELDHFDFGT